MSEVSIESDGIDVFVVYNGLRIAKRGDPNTPQAGIWVSLEPATECSTRIILRNWSLSATTKSSLLSQDEARRIALNIAKLPVLIPK